MSIKNTFKKAVGLAAIVGAVTLFGCEEKPGSIQESEKPKPKKHEPMDISSNPYKPALLENLTYLDPGTRVIVEGDILSIEEDRLILENKQHVASIIRNDYCTVTEAYDGHVGRNSYSADWQKLSDYLKLFVKNPQDTSNIYSNHIKIYGVVNSKKMLEMRFIEADGKLYESFK